MRYYLLFKLLFTFCLRFLMLSQLHNFNWKQYYKKFCLVLANNATILLWPITKLNKADWLGP